MPSSHLIIGGARSGKSRAAVEQQSAGRRTTFVATAEARDAGMAARIARHRAERPPSWCTVEEPVALAARLDALIGDAEAVVVDCLTLWVANLQLRGDTDDDVLDEARRVAELIAKRPYDITIVSNEVGEGVHPPTEAGLRFRDLLGSVNQVIAAACDRVTLMVAGLPLSVKAPAR
jgi:adenosylcobinamide kinase/adenosylcobinamide-phosphate guanylyltransferase